MRFTSVLKAILLSVLIVFLLSVLKAFFLSVLKTFLLSVLTTRGKYTKLQHGEVFVAPESLCRSDAPL